MTRTLINVSVQVTSHITMESSVSTVKTVLTGAKKNFHAYLAQPLLSGTVGNVPALKTNLMFKTTSVSPAMLPTSGMKT